MNQNKKILIIHDRFQFRGGAERLVLDLAQGIGADIITEFWEENATFARSEIANNLFILDRGEPLTIVWRYFRAQWNFFSKARKIIQQNNYDIIIFSGNNCLSASFFINKKIKKIYYCHAPVRYVYDLLPYRRLQENNLIKKFLYYDVGKYLIRFVYRLGLAQMDEVLTNSKNVQSRLQRFCKTQSKIVHPPINLNRFKWLGQADYYLSYARLDALKRVDDIVKAFQHMPEKKLKIASNGDDYEKIKNLVQGYGNIELLGWASNEKLDELVGQCIAVIYIPIDEDFGMTPVESMAAGKPCIVVNDGGLLESVINEKTGLIIPKNYKITDIINAVQKLTPDKAASMKAVCQTQAAGFSKDVFIQKMQDIIKFYI